MENRKMPDSARINLTYQLLNGFIGEGTGNGPQTREQMEIALLTEQIYQHRLNLCKRVSLEFEDKDMEAIVNAYEKLNRLCAGLMYHQGWLDASLAIQK